MRRAAVTVLLILLPLGVALPDIYRSVDAQGHVQYSDTPSPGAELIYRTNAQNAVSGASSEPTRDTALAKDNEHVNQLLAQQAVAREVQKETSEAHSKQCKEAQDNYTKSIQARRLYKAGEDGERQYLTDDEAEQQRVNYRLAMETACEGVSQTPAAAAEGSPSGAQ